MTAYLLGAIPTGYLLGRILKGIDIREYGSGNVGATNAFRTLGKIPGLIVLFFDIAKGAIVTTLVADLFDLEHVVIRVVLGMIVVAGHNWTIFLKFKGGKGIATSLGVLLGLMIKVVTIQAVVLVVILVWLCIFLTTGYVSLASITAAITLPVVMMVTNQTLELIVLGTVFCILVVVRHRSNIRRFLTGREPRVNLPFLKRE